MDQLIPSLAAVLAPLAPASRVEVYKVFGQMVAAWIVCLGRRTISRVWETTGQTKRRPHVAAYRLFSEAAWNWDEVCRLLLLQILTTLLPTGRLWLVVDDTLCHKRGAKVAFGGIFLDAVLSTKKHKVFRFGHNWVLLGVVVELSCRRNRYFCLPILWRLYEKQGPKSKKAHRTKSQLAADLVAVLAGWLPQRQFMLVADSAYIGKHLLRKRPANVQALGPLCWKAALCRALTGRAKHRRYYGDRLPTPAQMLADDDRWPVRRRTITFKNDCQRELDVKVITGVCWSAVTGREAVQVVLVRDPAGQWRQEALVCTDATLPVDDVICGYCRRWSVEVAFCDSKQLLGFHDPQVWCAASVQRAAPMAWFVGSLIVLWYVQSGQHGEQAHRHRPWYDPKESPTFADMLAACRVQLWRHWLTAESGSAADPADKLSWLLEYVATST